MSNEIMELINGIDKILDIADKKQPEENIIQTIAIYVTNVGRHDQKTKDILLDEGIKKIDIYREKKKTKINSKPIINTHVNVSNNNEIISTASFKTRRCIYAQDGYCRNGDKCTFAHNQQELIQKICRYGSECYNKYRCPFFHP